MLLSPSSAASSASLLQRLATARIPLSVSQVDSHRCYRKHRYHDRSKNSNLTNKYMHGRDDNQNFKLPLSGKRITIGREPANDIQVRSRFVSRFHARIVNDADRLQEVGIEDQGSRAGI